MNKIQFSEAQKLSKTGSAWGQDVPFGLALGRDYFETYLLPDGRIVALIMHNGWMPEGRVYDNAKDLHGIYHKRSPLVMEF